MVRPATSALCDELVQAAHLALGLADFGGSGYDEVLSGLLSRAVDHWRSEFEPVLTETDPARRLGKLVAWSLDVALAEPVLLALLVDELPLRFAAPAEHLHRALLSALQSEALAALRAAATTGAHPCSQETAQRVLAGWISTLKAIAQGTLN